MKLIVQIDYDFSHASNSNLQKKIQLQIQNTMKETNVNDDFKYIFKNLQHQDHNITTNDGTSSNSPSFHMKPLKG
jgi:hypothetical protein